MFQILSAIYDMSDLSVSSGNCSFKILEFQESCLGLTGIVVVGEYNDCGLKDLLNF